MADVVHLYEQVSDLRHELYELKLEVEWLRLPWSVRAVSAVWEFLRAPFGEWRKLRNGGDL